MSKEGLERQIKMADVITRLNGMILRLVPAIDPHKIDLDELNNIAAEASKCRELVAEINAAISRI